VVVERIDFFAKFSDSCAVDGETAFGDELLAGAPGSHAGIGEELLEANGRHGGKIDCVLWQPT